MVPQLSRVMLGIIGCRIQPDPLTAGLTSSGAPPPRGALRRRPNIRDLEDVTVLACAHG
jgi:hypothetical protein